MKTIAGLLLCVLVLSVSYCSRAPRNTPSDAEDTPQRVISLMPSLTEITYALGAEDKLVGVTNYCDYPPEVKTKKKAGDLISPNPERLLALNPDLILLSSPTQGQLSVDLANAGFRVALFPDPADLKGVFAQIQSLADTLGYSNQGKALVDSLKAELAAIKSTESLSVYIEMSADPLMSIGSASYLTDALEHIGLYNVFADKSQGYPVVSAEQVLVRAPDVVLFLYPDAAEAAQKRLGWSQLPAAKKGFVFDSLPVDELLRPGPRLIHALAVTDSLIQAARVSDAR